MNTILGILISTFGLGFCSSITLYNALHGRYVLCAIDILCVLTEVLCLIYFIQRYIA